MIINLLCYYIIKKIYYIIIFSLSSLKMLQQNAMQFSYFLFFFFLSCNNYTPTVTLLHKQQQQLNTSTTFKSIDFQIQFPFINCETFFFFFVEDNMYSKILRKKNFHNFRLRLYHDCSTFVFGTELIGETRKYSVLIGIKFYNIIIHL